MNDGGYVKLHRKLFTNKLWLSEKFTKAQAWVDLFANANHQDGSFWVRGTEVKIKRGQIGWSEVTMAQRWRWNRKTVRRFLSVLQEGQQITQQKNSFTSITTIINYDLYQMDGTAKRTPKGTADGTAEGTQTKNDKNVKKNTSDVPSQELHLFISLFKEVNPSYEQLFRNTTERGAAERLLKKFGLEKMEATARRLPEIIKQPYAPRITTPYELERNLGKLLAFVEQKKHIIQDKKPKIAFL